MACRSLVSHGWYINMNASVDRRTRMQAWTRTQEEESSVRLLRVEGARCSRHRRMPCGYDGNRRAHRRLLKQISNKPDLWYFVFEDDVKGNVSHACEVLSKFRNAHAVNLYSPRVAITLPYFATRTTAYAVRPIGAQHLFNASKAYPHLHIDIAFARYSLFMRHRFFTWVVPDVFMTTSSTSVIQKMNV